MGVRLVRLLQRRQVAATVDHRDPCARDEI
jgi:hypothetical protein